MADPFPGADDGGEGVSEGLPGGYGETPKPMDFGRVAGPIESFAEIIERMREGQPLAGRLRPVHGGYPPAPSAPALPANPLQWDKHPLSSEPLPGAGGACIEGSGALNVVGARHDRCGWMVRVLGAGFELSLSAEEARDLALQLSAMADVIEGNWGL